LFLVMTGGMAGIAGTVLVLYATFLAPLIPDAAAHFVIASVLGARRHLISLIMVPETSASAPAARWPIPICKPRAPWTRSSRAPRRARTSA
jgi:nucleoside permease NupC